MTAEEIIERMESERKKLGLSCADMDQQTWHSDGCYWKTKDNYLRGGGLALKNLIHYADILGLELAIRRKKEK